MRKLFMAAVVVAGVCTSSFAGAGFMINYSGNGPGFAGTVGLTDNLYLNLGASFSLEAIKSPDTIKGTTEVSFSVPLWLSIYLKKVGEVTPYIPIGIAYSMGIFTDADAKGGSTTIGIGPYTGFGVEWGVNSSIGIWGETDVGYTYSMTTVKTDGAPDVKSTKSNVSLIQSGVGITFYF